MRKLRNTLYVITLYLTAIIALKAVYEKTQKYALCDHAGQISVP